MTKDIASLAQTSIPFKDIPHFSDRDQAYTTRPDSFKDFVHFLPDLDAFAEVIQDRQQRIYPRDVLADVLTDQYESIGHD